MASSDVVSLDEFRSRCGSLPTRLACLPAGVDPVDQETLETVVQRRRRLVSEQRLVRAGDPMRVLFVARSGAFKATAGNAQGDEQVLGFFLPGELMGLDGLGRGRHRCDYVALETAEVCELGYDALVEAAAELPRLRAQLHRVVGQNIDRGLDHAGLLARKPAIERVAGFLDDLIDRHCMLGLQGTAFRLPMSREDIARFLGLTLESVSRSLSRMQDDGVLHVRGRQIDIVDPRVLSRLAQGMT